MIPLFKKCVYRVGQSRITVWVCKTDSMFLTWEARAAPNGTSGIREKQEERDTARAFVASTPKDQASKQASHLVLPVTSLTLNFFVLISFSYLVFTSVGISFLTFKSFLLFCFTWDISFSCFSGMACFPFCFSVSCKKNVHLIAEKD